MKLRNTTLRFTSILFLSLLLGLITSCGSDEPETIEKEEFNGQTDFTVSNSSVKTGEAATFNDTSTEVQERLWTFEGGKPNTSSEKDVTVTYYETGSFEAKLEITYTNGTKETKTVTVNVSETLLAAFSVNTQMTKETRSVAFQNLTSGGADSYEWTFEGGTPATSTEPNPTVVYATAGDYDVTLKAVRSSDSEEDIVTNVDYITVEANTVTANFTASEQSITEGESITFTNSSTGDVDTYAWTFTNGEDTPITSTEENPTITFDKPGSYTATLVATRSFDNASSTETKTDFFVVNQAPSEVTDAMLSDDGLMIELTFSKELNDPSTETVTVKLDDTSVTVASVGLKSGDATKMVITLNEAVVMGQTVEVTYSPTITATDGAPITALTDYEVDNSLDPAAGTNLIADMNPGFEEGMDEWVIQTDGVTEGATVEVITTDVHTGSKALRVKLNATGTSNLKINNGAATASVKLKAGSKYKIKYYYKIIAPFNEMTTRVMPRTGWKDYKLWSSGATVGEWKVKEDFLKVGGVQTLDADIEPLKIMLQFISKPGVADGEILLDDFEIYEVEE